MRVNKASTERHRFWALHLALSKGCATAFTHSRSLAALIGNMVSVDVATTLI